MTQDLRWRKLFSVARMHVGLLLCRLREVSENFLFSATSKEGFHSPVRHAWPGGLVLEGGLGG